MVYFNNAYILKCICPYARYCFYCGKRNHSNLVTTSERPCKPVELKKQKVIVSEFSIAYPIIINIDNNNIVTQINNSIINEVSKLFTSQVLVPENTDFTQVLGTYEIMLNQNGILSILFSLYTYINKAAHGFTAYSSITVNVETGKVYSFNDLFNPKLYYVGFLNEIAKQYIKENNILLINDYKGIIPNQQYYLTPDALVLYYQVYEYTPYYKGLFKIKIPYKQIINLLKDCTFHK